MDVDSDLAGLDPASDVLQVPMLNTDTGGGEELQGLSTVEACLMLTCAEVLQASTA